MDDVKEPLDELLDARADLHRALRGYFARRVPPADVDDLMQECYLRVANALAELKSKALARPWIFAIARNLVIDRARRLREVLPLEEEAVADADAAGAELDRRLARWLASMVDRLPPKYAVVVRESELEERPHREIAMRLGLSVSAVKSRVQRGRALLRGMLLACCAYEFDRRGGITDYRQNRPGACGC